MDGAVDGDYGHAHGAGAGLRGMRWVVIERRGILQSGIAHCNMTDPRYDNKMIQTCHRFCDTKDGNDIHIAL